jgi:hypothetical protein
MVVRVDQAWGHQVATRVNHLVGSLGQIGSGAHRLDPMSADHDGRIVPFMGQSGVGIVKSGNAVGVFDQQGGHGGEQSEENKRPAMIAQQFFSTI